MHLNHIFGLKVGEMYWKLLILCSFSNKFNSTPKNQNCKQKWFWHEAR